MTLKSFFIAVATSIVFASCGTATHIVSNSAPTLPNPPKRIFIHMKGDDITDRLYKDLWRYLGMELGLRKVGIDFHIDNHLSMKSENEVREQIDRFQPDVILTIQQGNFRAGETAIGITEPVWAYTENSVLNLTLAETSGKAVWKGILRVNTINAGQHQASYKIARRIVKQMQTDGVLNN
jgi:hypothetical protein